jgi:hypothetical protein
LAIPRPIIRNKLISLAVISTICLDITDGLSWFRKNCTVKERGALVRKALFDGKGEKIKMKTYRKFGCHAQGMLLVTRF